MATNGLHHKETAGADYAEHATKQRKPYDYGGNPLAREDTSDTTMIPAFGGSFQPGLFKVQKSNIANPAPLGLSAFALTTFILSLINLGTRHVDHPNLVVASAFGYGGLVQLLAGMWEMAVGNTFGATALSSYGGFWISFAITLTPGGFQIIEELSPGGDESVFYDSFGFFLFGWFIFTFILWLCTLKSTVAFCLLFFTLMMAFLMLAIAYLVRVPIPITAEDATGTEPHPQLVMAGGGFGIIAAFIAWYNALAGIANRSNSFFLIPVAHFPWSDKGRERRGKVDNSASRAEQGEA